MDWGSFPLRGMFFDENENLSELKGVFMVKIKCIVSDICEENGYVVWKDGAKECVLIDPGFSAGRFLDFMASEDLTNVAAIFCTHGHADHIGGINALRERFPEAKIVIGKKDADKLTDSKKNLARHFGINIVFPPADLKLSEAQTELEFAGVKFTAFQTPGHSAGHVVYLLKVDEGQIPVVFAGDLIFYGSVGRTDFFDGNPKALVESIQNVIFSLSDETELFTGHGPATTVGVERRTNPYVREG